MRKQFPLFQSHLDLAHQYWKDLLKVDDIVIDATCGNGHDTLKLSEYVTTGKIYALDIQDQAIESAKLLLHNSSDRVTFLKQCHSTFPNEIQPATVKLIVYNLGYLPGGEKEKTTKRSTTIVSILQAKELIISGGAISITCYPGHLEGAEEEKEILAIVSTWNPKEWSCCHHRLLNRHLSPSLLLLQKT